MTMVIHRQSTDLWILIHRSARPARRQIHYQSATARPESTTDPVLQFLGTESSANLPIKARNLPISCQPITDRPACGADRSAGQVESSEIRPARARNRPIIVRQNRGIVRFITPPTPTIMMTLTPNTTVTTIMTMTATTATAAAPA